jgi:hypothetical protein
MIVGCLAENWNEWVSESENLAHVGTCLKCLELVILTLEKCIFYGFILYIPWCDSLIGSSQYTRRASLLSAMLHVAQRRVR